jgi:MSHA biogenesis protein MshG
MQIFNYQGRDQKGGKVNGSLEAENTSDVIKFLQDKDIIPIDIVAGKKQQNKLDAIAIFFNPKASIQDLLNFSRQMATLIGAGVPIIKAIKQLATSTRSKVMQRTLTAIAAGIEAGKSLAVTLTNYPKIFSKIYVSLVEIGENIGHLDTVFSQLSSFLEAQIANRKRLVATVRYPMIVIIMLGVAMIIMTLFVVPKFTNFFNNFKIDLPLPTRIMIATSDFMLNHWLFILMVLIVFIITIIYLLKIPKIELWWDKTKLKFPVLGDLMRRIILVQFTRTFGMILNAGVPMLKGLSLGANASGNQYIRQQILVMRDGIERGESFTNSASQSELFTSDMLQLIEVGEETGKLDDMLIKIASIHEAEIDYTIKNLNDLLEPILLVVVGGFVAMIALSVYLPMWDMVKAIKH